MRKSFPLLFTAVCLALLSTGEVWAQETKLDLPAPALTFKDLEGQTISLAALKGKVVVVDFLATYCDPCREEIPGYIEMQKKYGKDGLVIIGISLDTKKPAYVKKFIEANGMNYAVVMGDLDTLDAFGDFHDAQIYIPTTFLINREGRIVSRKVGPMESVEYEAIVKKVL